MYVKRAYRKRPAAPKRRRGRVVRKSSVARKSITQIVKSVISRQAENKVWFDYGANQSIVNSIGGNPIFKNLCPTLAQGTGHSQRVGNEVRVKSGYVKGHVNILPFDNIINNLPLPCYVKMWVCSYRATNTTNIAATNISINFFDVVSGSVGMQGNMLDMNLTPNKDAWVIHGTKTCKIGAGYNSSTGPVGSVSYFDNSPMSVPFYFNIGKIMKTIKYDDSTNQPLNKNLFIVFQCVPANGASGASQFLAEFHHAIRVEYEDM